MASENGAEPSGETQEVENPEDVQDIQGIATDTQEKNRVADADRRSAIRVEAADESIEARIKAADDSITAIITAADESVEARIKAADEHIWARIEADPRFSGTRRLRRPDALRTPDGGRQRNYTGLRRFTISGEREL